MYINIIYTIRVIPVGVLFFIAMDPRSLSVTAELHIYGARATKQREKLRCESCVDTVFFFSLFFCCRRFRYPLSVKISGNMA